MKIKLILLVIIFLQARTICTAQMVRAKPFTKGKSYVSAGHGIGNIWKTFLDKAITIPDYKVTTNGPYILIYEYGFTKRISAGISGSYSVIKGNYPGSSRYGKFTDKLTIFSILARGDYHFGKRATRLDPYLGVGLGYNNSRYSNSDASINVNSKVPGTFEYSGQLGLKYYFIPHVGIYSELGYVAGSFVQIGIAAYF